MCLVIHSKKNHSAHSKTTQIWVGSVTLPLLLESLWNKARRAVRAAAADPVQRLTAVPLQESTHTHPLLSLRPSQQADGWWPNAGPECMKQDPV